MQLKHIKTNKCPECGCDTVIKETIQKEYNQAKLRFHCNGGLWENREFLCGCIIVHEANFLNRESIDIESCVNNKAILERNRKRKEAMDKLMVAEKELIPTLDVDEEWKNDQINKRGIKL